MNAALAVIGATFAVALLLGIRARSGRQMNLAEWAVGGRRFGAILVFLLLVGEIYTTFTFLGASGWAYGRGAPAFYILCYGAVAYIMSYWLAPAIWRYARDHDLVSQPDFFVQKYRSRALGTLVALVGVVALIPYLVLQLKGLGIIVSEASFGAVSPTMAIWIGVAGVVGYVMISGIHGSAWTAVIKDILILGVAIFLGLYLPAKLHGGFGPMFARIEAAAPGFLTLPARGQSASWFASTVLLTALGFYLWPHTFGSIYSAKSGDAFRKNAVVMPLYQLVMLFVFFVGFAAKLAVPGLEGTDADLALLRVSVATFDPWLVGLIGAAGVLTALVPGSMILMAAGTIVAKNVWRSGRSPADPAVARLAKLLVPVVAAVALWFTLRGGDSIVALLLMGYSLVTQLAPALLFSLLPRNPLTATGAIAGLLAGVATVAAVTLGGSNFATLMPWAPSAIQDLNVGFAALLINVTVAWLVSLGTGSRGPDYS
ncbi:MAG: sodium:solute symporter family protein [Gemmatimonadetes bacterium]|nr:sodium:solute symporter family protein [Gemmatimonadota bacterium]